MLNKKYNNLICEIVLNYKKLINTYKLHYTNSIKEFETSFKINLFTYLKAWVGLFYYLFYNFQNQRIYFFESLRNHEIINLFDSKQITILGGNNDRYVATKRKYGFMWTSPIYSAIILAGSNKTSIPIKLTTLILKYKFNKQKIKFFLYEDTLPIGIFFSLFGKYFNKQTICIQHGFGTSKEILFDGSLCKHNLLYSITQKRFIKTSTKFYELGLPFDINLPVEKSNEVILIGTGWKGLDPEFYEKSLIYYNQLKQIFKKSNYKVFYRPHPNESEIDYQFYNFKIDKKSKIECLSNTQKIFIGYISTLLYEAKVSNHLVINILDNKMNPLAFETDLSLNPLYTEDILYDINNLYENKKINYYQMDSLKSRFFKIFDQIENI
jgi:hypothetical protein